MLLAIFSSLIKMPFMVGLLFAFQNLPTTFALPEHSVFPDISFKVFSAFIQQTLGPSASLSTVLSLVFSILENPELLSLHAHQQCPKYPGENTSSASGWIKHFARTVQDRLGNNTNQLFRRQDIGRDMTEDQVLIVTASKLVALAQVLHFYPVDKHGNFLGKLKPVSQKSI
jgi:hypothetical protein